MRWITCSFFETVMESLINYSEVPTTPGTMGMPGTKRGDSGGSRLVGNSTAVPAESLCRIREGSFCQSREERTLTKQVPPSGLWEFTLRVPGRACMESASVSSRSQDLCFYSFFFWNNLKGSSLTCLRIQQVSRAATPGFPLQSKAKAHKTHVW